MITDLANQRHKPTRPTIPIKVANLMIAFRQSIVQIGVEPMLTESKSVALPLGYCTILTGINQPNQQIKGFIVLMFYVKVTVFHNGPCRTRTYDRAVMSRLL